MNEETAVKRGFWIAKGLKVLVLVAVVIGVVGFVTMSLWNWLVPALFSGPAVSYWQALGLLVLARLLFGGMRHHGRGRFGPWGHHMGREWRERWEQMTPEEREQLRGRFREGWGGRRGFCRETPAAEPKA